MDSESVDIIIENLHKQAYSDEPVKNELDNVISQLEEAFKYAINRVGHSKRKKSNIILDCLEPILESYKFYTFIYQDDCLFCRSVCDKTVLIDIYYGGSPLGNRIQQEIAKKEVDIIFVLRDYNFDFNPNYNGNFNNKTNLNLVKSTESKSIDVKYCVYTKNISGNWNTNLKHFSLPENQLLRTITPSDNFTFNGDIWQMQNILAEAAIYVKNLHGYDLKIERVYGHEMYEFIKHRLQQLKSNWCIFEELFIPLNINLNGKNWSKLDTLRSDLLLFQCDIENAQQICDQERTDRIDKRVHIKHACGSEEPWLNKESQIFSVDFYNPIVVELKSNCDDLLDATIQAVGYMAELQNNPQGMVINFNVENIQVRRIEGTIETDIESGITHKTYKVGKFKEHSQFFWNPSSTLLCHNCEKVVHRGVTTGKTEADKNTAETNNNKTSNSNNEGKTTWINNEGKTTWTSNHGYNIGLTFLHGINDLIPEDIYRVIKNATRFDQVLVDLKLDQIKVKSVQGIDDKEKEDIGWFSQNLRQQASLMRARGAGCNLPTLSCKRRRVYYYLLIFFKQKDQMDENLKAMWLKDIQEILAQAPLDGMNRYPEIANQTKLQLDKEKQLKLELDKASQNQTQPKSTEAGTQNAIAPIKPPSTTISKPSTKATRSIPNPASITALFNSIIDEKLSIEAAWNRLIGEIDPNYFRNRQNRPSNPLFELATMTLFYHMCKEDPNKILLLDGIKNRLGGEEMLFTSPLLGSELVSLLLKVQTIDLTTQEKELLLSLFIEIETKERRLQAEQNAISKQTSNDQNSAENTTESKAPEKTKNPPPLSRYKLYGNKRKHSTNNNNATTTPQDQNINQQNNNNATITQQGQAQNINNTAMMMQHGQGQNINQPNGNGNNNNATITSQPKKPGKYDHVPKKPKVTNTQPTQQIPQTLNLDSNTNLPKQGNGANLGESGPPPRRAGPYDHAANMRSNKATENQK